MLEVQVHQNIRLDLPATNEQGVYLCLNHCWGGVEPQRLTDSTLTTFLEAIPWEHLLLTFQHAVSITARLGFKYLWIDSLCILQDSIADWRDEGVNMCSIYPGAHLTLATIASSDDDGGLIDSSDSDLDEHDTLVHHSPHDQDETLYGVYARTSEELFLENNLPLQKRAWLYQE